MIFKFYRKGLLWGDYFDIVSKADDNLCEVSLEHFDFYERAKKAYAVIATGEEAVYANIIIKKEIK